MNRLCCILLLLLLTAPASAPPTLVTAGSRDETAVPSHAYKYVAALQRVASCESPVLLQVVEGAGHSYGRLRSSRRGRGRFSSHSWNRRSKR